MNSSKRGRKKQVQPPVEEPCEKDCQECSECKFENESIKNYYDLPETKAFVVNYENPNRDFVIQHPSNILIYGCTGSGKGNILMNILSKMACFAVVKVFCLNKDEPLYNMLESRLSPDQLFIFEGMDAIKKELNRERSNDELNCQCAYIFDDLVIYSKKGDHKEIEKIFITGRKLQGNHGITAIYLTQSYYDTSKVIRKNVKFVIVKKVANQTDMRLILRDSALLDCSRFALNNMYNHCVAGMNDITNFLLINLAVDETNRFRKNFTHILNPNDFEPGSVRISNDDEIVDFS